jgi:hypothetical protein
VETDRRRRWASFMLAAAGGMTELDPVAVEPFRWKRLLKTALPTDPLRGRFMFSWFSLLLFDMMVEHERRFLAEVWCV